MSYNVSSKIVFYKFNDIKFDIFYNKNLIFILYRNENGNILKR